MNGGNRHVPIRFVVPFLSVLLLLFFALPWMAVYSSYEAQVWKQFWLASASVGCLAILWASLRRGGVWLRALSGLLAIVPCFILYWALSDHFGWHTFLNLWEY